jgi:hypothetical protein
METVAWVHTVVKFLLYIWLAPTLAPRAATLEVFYEGEN